MFFSRAVLYLQIVLAELLDPASELTFRVLESKQPSQAAVVSSQYEPPSQQVMPELPGELHHRQQLTTCHAVALLLCLEMGTPIGDNFFHPLLSLGQHTPDADIRCVCVQYKLSRGGRVGQDGCRE